VTPGEERVVCARSWRASYAPGIFCRVENALKQNVLELDPAPAGVTAASAVPRYSAVYNSQDPDDLPATEADAKRVRGMSEAHLHDSNSPADLRERIAGLERENEQLRTALESRIIIEQAKGAISVRSGVTPGIAFELMRRLARSSRREIHEYAAEIVANGGGLHPHA
jgi:ANTAR domain